MASAIGLTETSPQMDWTRDAKIYDCYLNWKTKVELIFNSVLSKATAVQKSSYLWLWMGNPGIPLIRKRTLGKYPSNMLKLEQALKYPMATNWKPFGIYSMRSWNLKGTNYFQWLSFGLGASKGQNHLMNGWPMYTIYPTASKERIIRDVLIINCSNEKVKDKIIRKGHEIKLEEVIGILQTEDSTQRMWQEMNSETKKLHYASYDKKKSGSKGNKKKSFTSPAPKSSGSTSQSYQSTSSGRLCYRCRKPYTKEHETAKCNGCGWDWSLQELLQEGRKISIRSHSIQRRCILQVLQNKSSMMKKEIKSLLAVNTCYPWSIQNHNRNYSSNLASGRTSTPLTKRLPWSWTQVQMSMLSIGQHFGSCFQMWFYSWALSYWKTLIRLCWNQWNFQVFPALEGQGLQDPGRSDGLWRHSQCLIKGNNFPHGHSETLLCSQKSSRDYRWNSYNELQFQGWNDKFQDHSRILDELLSQYKHQEAGEDCSFSKRCSTYSSR